jgi:hypothetical protein
LERGVYAASSLDFPGRFDFKRTHDSVSTLKRRERRAPMGVCELPPGGRISVFEQCSSAGNLRYAKARLLTKYAG